MSFHPRGGNTRRPSHSGSYPRRGPHGRTQQRRSPHQGQFIHHSKFINKGVDEAVKPYEAKHSFADFVIDERIKANITKKGYVTPSAIQDQAIPVVLSGKDVVGIANTGTGKTAAFLLPLIDMMLKQPREKAIVVVPTRELANQIRDEFAAFVQGMPLTSVCCVGGTSIVPQIRGLARPVNLVIGTPGRLKDLIDSGKLRLGEFRTIVLDEADRMLDMGFIHSIRFMISKMPTPRRTLFFSATLGAEIERLIKDFLHEPVRISVKTGDTSKNVDQDVVHTQGKDKFLVLRDLLVKPEFDKVLVFGRTKHGVERLAKTLTQTGIPAASIHGNKTQNHRERSLADFKANKIKVLVATDVAARGLDIPKVSHVINFDVPATYEDYVHRIGRTGRAGARGKALTFIESAPGR